MSQSIGYQFKSRISTLSDDASIEEAFKVYHYGVDDYTTQPIPDDSIEGNFRSLDSRIDVLESGFAGLPSVYVEQVSASATPNIITGQTTTTVPITIRAIASQTSNLQQWQTSASVNIASMTTTGSFAHAGYGTIGSATHSTTTALNIVLANAAHKGIVVKSASSQTENLQEWQDSSGVAMAWIDKDGRLYRNGEEIGQAAFNYFLLMGA